MSTRERRGFTENVCFFVTTTFNSWLHLFVNDEYYSIVTKSIEFCCAKYVCDVISFVLMPSHIHIILFFNSEPNCPAFMRDFKKYTSRQIRQLLQQDERTELLEKIEYNKNKQFYKVWQTRYDAVVLRYSSVLETKMKYIHENPVKANLVEEDWQWVLSSAGWYKDKIASKIVLRHAADIMY